MNTEIAVKERPILFSGPMVRAILEGRKTQTRRVVKHPEYHGCMTGDCPHSDQRLCDSDLAKFAREECPHGRPGDRLWVRETWRCLSSGCAETKIQYCADGNTKTFSPFMPGADAHKLVRPSIFLPRWASRITLEITDVRVQRVQEISGKDVIAEGSYLGRCACMPRNNDRGLMTAFRQEWCHIHGQEFCHLWDSINAKRGHGWDANPWVWAISFKRVTE